MILDSNERIEQYTKLGAWGNLTLNQMFKKNVEKNPEKEALADQFNRIELTGVPPRRLTYSESDFLIDTIATNLLKSGIKKDDIVIVQLPNIVELALTYLALSRIGAIGSPLPIQYRKHEMTTAVQLIKPKAIITIDEFNGYSHANMALKVAEEKMISKVIVVGNNIPKYAFPFHKLEQGEPNHNELDNIETSPNDIFTIGWTSGTTGSPKGVPRSHNQWLATSRLVCGSLGLTDKDIIHCPFPLINMAAFGVLYIPWILSGGTLILQHPFDMLIYLKQIQTEKITFTGGAPAIHIMLLKDPTLLKNYDISSIRYIAIGSAPVPSFVVQTYRDEYQIEVVNIYGSNEGTTLLSLPTEVPDPIERGSLFPRWGIEGFESKIYGTEWIETKLVNPVTKEVINEFDIPGELYFRSPSIFPGYWKLPEENESSFEDGFFKSGDLFSIASETRYRFEGRVKDLIIRGGQNISPEEVESLLQGHPKLAEVAIVGYPDERLGEKMCAFVVPKQGESVTLEELTSFLNMKEVAKFKWPERLEIIDKIPRNPVGKILKNSLREIVASK